MTGTVLDDKMIMTNETATCPQERLNQVERNIYKYIK